VPGRCNTVITFNMTAWRASKALQARAKDRSLERWETWFQKQTGIPMADVTCLALALDPWAVPPAGPLLMVRTSRPIPTARVVGRLKETSQPSTRSATFRETVVERTTVYESKLGPPDAPQAWDSFCFPDTRVLLYGSTDLVRNALAEEKPAAARRLRDALAQATASDILFVAMDLKDRSEKNLALFGVKCIEVPAAELGSPEAVVMRSSGKEQLGLRIGITCLTARGAVQLEKVVKETVASNKESARKEGRKELLRALDSFHLERNKRRLRAESRLPPQVLVEWLSTRLWGPWGEDGR
jgi:hypothetical protein